MSGCVKLAVPSCCDLEKPHVGKDGLKIYAGLPCMVNLCERIYEEVVRYVD